MTEFTYKHEPKTDSGDVSRNVTVAARSIDADSLSIGLTAHYKDNCQGTMREPGFGKMVDNMIDNGVMMAVKMESAGQKTANGFGEQLKNDDFRLKIEAKINQDVGKLLKNFCLESNGIDINSLKTNH